MEIFNYPLVGIYASKGRKKDTFRGDITVFKSIQKEMKNYGAQTFVFTTDNIHADGITGYVYFEGYNRWGKISFPFPDLIYNKISTRSEETSSEFQHLYQLYRQKEKPFFNPGFFNKWDSHLALSQQKNLEKSLPKTWIYTKEVDLVNLMHTYPSLYLKPVNGHKGSGIVRIMKNDPYFTIQTKQEQFKMSASELKTWIEDSFFQSNSYIIQEEIETDKFDGCKYDLRVLCMYMKGGYSSVGVGVRKAPKGSIVTHVPNGGEILPFQKVQDRCSIEQIDLLANQVGSILTENLGFIGEFSMDIGIATNGSPYLFEINSKPMIFDEDDIQRKRIVQLVELFLSLTQNTNIR
ncbi:MAG TPA: YheC/YheD family protein [Metabacillus sp.]|nr:YheC/YheD family protein [Metabacillus sp.]